MQFSDTLKTPPVEKQRVAVGLCVCALRLALDLIKRNNTVYYGVMNAISHPNHSTQSENLKFYECENRNCLIKLYL